MDYFVFMQVLVLLKMSLMSLPITDFEICFAINIPSSDAQEPYIGYLYMNGFIIR